MNGRDLLLVFNAGSSSLKFEVFEPGAPPRSLLHGAIRDIGRTRPLLTIGDANEIPVSVAGARDAAVLVLDRLCRGDDGVRLSARNLLGTGHRVVHGGAAFSEPVRVTASVFDTLKSLVDLAPLHNPPSLAVMEAVGERFPQVPIVAVFDTAFFHDLPEPARDYAIPRDWAERHAIRRYGFHGIAHRYLAARVAEAPRDGPPPRRVLSLHLGQGCSITALDQGRPVETSMGFTPLEGLIMGTRSGDVDAGVVLQLVREGHGVHDLDDALNRRSGLAGLSGVSGDVRDLLELESRGHDGARRALAAFHHRLHKYLGAYTAVLGGVDAVVFGGGIGENSPVVRERACAGLHWLGLELDSDANRSCAGAAARISAAASRIEVHVFPVDEEPLIAEAAMSVLGGGSVPV